MTRGRSSTPDYTMGFSDEMIQAIKRYNVKTHAAHLLPYLKPGLRVLDFGCGPGTISIGLAEAVEPGELHCIDMEESQIAQAMAMSRAGRHDNMTFHVGDAGNLPFEANFFDVIHCHNVLMHIPDTRRVLREVKRALKPGGIVSSREMICGSCFTHPDSSGFIRKAWDMLEDLIAANEGHPQMGKDMKFHFIEAGFDDIRMSTSFNTYSTPEDVAFTYEFVSRWFLSPEITEAAVQYGASTEEMCNEMRAAYDKWKDHPGAVCSVAYGEIIARKPLD